MILEKLVELILEYMIPLCELIGIFVVSVSVIKAFCSYLHSLATRVPCNVKVQLASGLGLGLEFKMASEILKTVLIRDLSELLVLGIVIGLRALLSVLIHFEMKEPADNPLESSRIKED